MPLTREWSRHFQVLCEYDCYLLILHIICEFVTNLSKGGQQARLLLASALIVEPDMLLLDEPTNNLDVNGIDTLTEYILATQKTTLVISHDEVN